MKKLLLSLFLALVATWATAQQVGRYSMYMQNFYAVNAAATGLEDHVDITLGFRKQWLGFDNAPQNYFASFNMPLSKERRSPAPGSIRISDPNLYATQFPTKRQSKHSVGGMVNVNQFGAFKYTQAFGSYAFHLPVARKLNLSFGANVGMNNYAIDQSLIELEMPNDAYYTQVLADAQQNATLLDIDFGLMLYSRLFFVGYSSEQLLGNNVGFGGKSQFGSLPVNHRLLLGRKIKVNRQLNLMPNGFFYFNQTGLLSSEVNLRADYNDQVWAGISYRHGDAVVPMFGVYLNDMIKIGYAFDYTISGLRKYSPGGSHEIMLGWMIGNRRTVF